MNKRFSLAIDILVPLGIPIRSAEDSEPRFSNWGELIWRFLPQTFFIYWLFRFIPFAGGFAYMLCLVPLSVLLHARLDRAAGKHHFASQLLVYYTVILIGFGGIWSFIGHTILADQVAADIGWQTGSPFQTELAFYTLGSGIAGLMAVWIRGHFITAIVVTKSVFWYGAAFVHIRDAIVNQNYSPLNIGAPLIGDIIYPTLLLVLLYLSTRISINGPDLVR